MSAKHTSGEAPEIVTRVGRAGTTDHLFFGARHFADLPGNQTFTGLLGMAVAGRAISRDACEVLDDVAAVMTFGDPRIWPLKVTRIVSAYGHALPAWAAGMIVLENPLAGPWTMIETASNVAEVAVVLAQSGCDSAACRVREVLARSRRLLGFGVPFRPHDERLDALRTCLERRGRTSLAHWRASEIMAEVVRAERRTEPNIGLGVAAVCLDLGFAPEEVPAVGAALAQYVFVATAVEGAREAPEALRELPASSMRYAGKPARTSPARAGSVARSSEAHASTSRPTTGSAKRGRILVVDDEPLVAAAVGRTLQAYDVSVLTKPFEVVERIAAGDRFDAIVCDVMMPGLSGADLFAAIRSASPDQARRMVFLTGGAQTETTRAFLRSVPNVCLEKPFDPSEIVGLVERMLVR